MKRYPVVMDRSCDRFTTYKIIDVSRRGVRLIALICMCPLDILNVSSNHLMLRLNCFQQHLVFDVIGAVPCIGQSEGTSAREHIQLNGTRISSSTVVICFISPTTKWC